MKLASLKHGRDGQLCVVNRDLTTAILVPHISPTLQAAIENWSIVAPQLNQVYRKLNQGILSNAFLFDTHLVSSPLARAYQWLDGSAYVNHVELVRKARGATMPANFWTDPLMYQGGSDYFLEPCSPIITTDESFGIDFEAELAIISDDVPMGVKLTQASQHIILFMLVNDISLRNLIPAELEKGFGFLQSKPASSFSPVAVTPDELEPYWDGARLHLELSTYLNNNLFGSPNAGTDMTFSFPELIVHAAKTRNLSAGTIIGSGTVSNLDRRKGSSCIAEKRMLEIIAQGKACTPFMQFGDTVRIEMQNLQRQNIFGSIEQTLCAAT